MMSLRPELVHVPAFFSSVTKTFFFTFSALFQQQIQPLYFLVKHRFQIHCPSCNMEIITNFELKRQAELHPHRFI